MSIAGIDIVFGLLLIAIVLRCLIRGFVKELLSMAAVIGGLICAALFSGVVGEYIARWLGVSIWNQVMAFLMLFAIVYLTLKLFESVLHRWIERIHLEGLDRALGLLLGIAEGITLLLILMLLIRIQPFIHSERLLGKSRIAEALAPLMPFLNNLLNGGTIDV